ncbi:MAG: DNA repair protein RecO, partial [Anaerolineales bacterium]
MEAERKKIRISPGHRLRGMSPPESTFIYPRNLLRREANGILQQQSMVLGANDEPPVSPLTVSIIYTQSPGYVTAAWLFGNRSIGSPVSRNRGLSFREAAGPEESAKDSKPVPRPEKYPGVAGIIDITMPRERTYQIEAVILRRRNWGEADRILTLFTPQRGKIRAR